MPTTENTKTNENTYTEGIGRRKTARARVRIYPANETSFRINETHTLEEYFPQTELQEVASQSLKHAGDTFFISAHVAGGGISAQAEAIRHGIARAVAAREPNFRTVLKKAGFLKRDPREKERKKFGLKKARKRAQWSKR